MSKSFSNVSITPEISHVRSCTACGRPNRANSGGSIQLTLAPEISIGRAGTLMDFLGIPIQSSLLNKMFVSMESETVVSPFSASSNSTVRISCAPIIFRSTTLAAGISAGREDGPKGAPPPESRTTTRGSNDLQRVNTPMSVSSTFGLDGKGITSRKITTSQVVVHGVFFSIHMRLISQHCPGPRPCVRTRMRQSENGR